MFTMPKRSTSTLRTRISIFASALTLALLPALSLAQDLPQTSYYSNYGWQIDSMDAVIEVHEDASLKVTETIKTQFNPEFFKHGIYREIPVVYRDDFGDRVKIGLHIESISQNGEPATYTVSRDFDMKVIKIGDGDIEISGPVEYRIVYNVDHAMLYLDDYDEIYWNTTGTEWEVPIQQSSALVILPDGTEITSKACYTGDYGSENQDCGIAVEGSKAAFASNDFMTVAVGFPKGVVAEPTFWENVLFFLKDNSIAVIPILLILAMAAFWYAFGKDPKMDTVIAEFEPPENISAVYAGYIVKNGYASQFNAAMIVQMAVDGYLQIFVEEKKTKLGIKTKDVSLKKLKTSDGLDEAHKALFDAMFKDVEVSGKATLVKIRKNVGQSGAMGKVISAVKKKIKDDGIYSNKSFLFRTLLAGFVSGPLFWGSFAFAAFYGMFTAVLFFIAAIFAAVFAYLMPKRTRKGTELARRILGFKLFMHTAERYRSKWHEEQNMFTDYLPYAIAFKDVKKWANTFKDLDFQNPSWYVSNVHYVSAWTFADDLTGTTSSIRTAMAYRSSPSGGSHGGGFSGGGFGGGGGGSW